ncbi:MAG: T9SS type A sorting domain-containing protein [Candidatus Azobacteroides sp.]|nr:T9SS type A sorting domain-containing protein [Candidatus Azobacteroides sp.]
MNSEISLKNLPAGNYIINLYDKNGKEYTVKLIKK